MKDIKEEAKRQGEARLRSYGADAKACGGAMKKYASGGKVDNDGDEKHPDRKKDLHLIKELEADHEPKKRADGGPIAAGGGSPKLGRGRKGGKGGKTNIAIMVGKPGGDGAGAPPPPALGAGPGPAPVNLAPKPMPPMGPGGPPPGGPPMKRGGSVKKK